MIDGVPKQTGNSRFLKSAIPEGITHEELVAMLRNGTFPVDLNGINADGWAQLGTPLNKANLISDQTASSLGLDSNATPNTAFARIIPLLEGIKTWVKSEIVLGEFIAGSGTNTKYVADVNLGFRPRIVILFDKQSINTQTIPTRESAALTTNTVRIIVDSVGERGKLTDSGFTAEFYLGRYTDLIPVNYIAIK